MVVGHGGSGKTSLLLGSTAHHLVHHAHVPVVVVRGELRIPVRRLVVGVDGFDARRGPDDRSMAALRWALRLPGATHVEVSHADFVPAVAAGPVREPGLESDEETAEDDARLRRAIDRRDRRHRRGAERRRDRARRRRRDRRLRADRGVARRRPRRHRHARAAPGCVELIVGSTTLEVLAHAHCPVAVVR